MYVFYKITQKPQKEPTIKNLGKAKVVSNTPCPSPKVFVDYVAGKMNEKEKEEIRRHIDICKDCMDALQAVFNLPTEEELKKKKVP
jgi:hypothetical protein